MQTLEEHQSVLAQTKSFVEKNGQVSPLTVVDDDLAKALGDYKGYAIDTPPMWSHRIFRVLEQIKEKAEQSTGRFKKNEPKSYLKQAVATKTQSELLTLLNKDLNRSWEFLQVGPYAFFVLVPLTLCTGQDQPFGEEEHDACRGSRCSYE